MLINIKKTVIIIFLNQSSVSYKILWLKNSLVPPRLVTKLKFHYMKDAYADGNYYLQSKKGDILLMIYTWMKYKVGMKYKVVMLCTSI